MTKIRLTLTLLAAGGVSVYAQQPSKPAPPTATPAIVNQTQNLRGRLVFKPIGMGAPSGRVDAGSRGDGDEMASLYVIAPETIGLSARSQPTLFWFQSQSAALRLELSVLKPNDPQPLLRVRIKDANSGGFHRLDLAKHGVKLEAGVDYQWVVALIRDPQSRSRDIVSSGWIRHDTGAAGDHQDAAGLAASGFWYDCVSTLFAQIDARPADAQLTADRRDLFTQVGLPPLPTVPSKK